MYLFRQTFSAQGVVRPGLLRIPGILHTFFVPLLFTPAYPLTMWIIILALLIIGLALIVVEVVFIPGTTIVGIVGVVFAGAGIIFSYRHFGSETGLYILLGTVTVTAVALYFSFRSEAWSRFANKSTMEGKVNEGMTALLQLGDEGVSVSTLKPMGTAKFASGQFEVKTLGDYVDVGTKVKIVHIEPSQIIVKPLT